MTQAAGTRNDEGWFTTAVAEELRAQLARKRVTGRELARRLHVSAQWISQRTKGTVALSTADIERISLVLGIEPADLLGGALHRGIAATTNGPGTDSVSGRYQDDIGGVVIDFPQLRARPDSPLPPFGEGLRHSGEHKAAS